MKQSFQIGSLVFALVCLISVPGCYQRMVAPSYTSEESEVERIRSHLGAMTLDKEFIKEEAEDE